MMICCHHLRYVRFLNSGCTPILQPDRVMEFCNNNDLQLIVRAHECVMDGFERFAQGHLITLFSATNYCGMFKTILLLILPNLFSDRSWLVISIDLLFSRYCKQCWSYPGIRKGSSGGSKTHSSSSPGNIITGDISRTSYWRHLDAGMVNLWIFFF